MLKSWTHNDVALLKLDTAFAENTLMEIDLGNRAVIPPHLAPGRVIYFSADNIDINYGTLDWKHTLHATLCKTWQRCPSHVVRLKSTTPAMQTTLAVPEVMNTIFHASDTGVTTELQFDNGIQVEWLSESPSFLKAQATDHAIFIQQGGHSRT